MSVKALAKSVKISPRKVSQVAALVRGRTVVDAYVILSHVDRKKSSKAVLDVIKSASANAVHNHGYKEDGLYISEITVNHGPRTKRFRPVARGMSHPYMLRTSHIKVLLDGQLRQSAKTEVTPKAEVAPKKVATAKKKTTKETK